MQELKVNGKTLRVDVPPDMPVLWVLRDVIGLTGTKFGCGIAACGACTVHLDGQPIRSCVTPVSAVAGKSITTIEAIGETPAGAAVADVQPDLPHRRDPTRRRPLHRPSLRGVRAVRGAPAVRR